MIHQVAAGMYTYLPLGLRVLRKIEHIVHEEMEKLSAEELFMPVLQPLEMWQETGRDLAFGKSLFTLQDRKGRGLCLAPTHEEVITELVARNVKSYRDLPLYLYQIQTKFRDEPRPRGGLIRLREFAMKDLYSFDADDEGLNESYHKMIQAYSNILARCGLPSLLVAADSGAIGGKESHEFMVLSESGEAQVIYCPQCNYAANVERASFAKEGLAYEEPLPLEEVKTPGVGAIDDLARLLDIPKSRTLKAVFYFADGELVFVTIRGDLEVNEVKLKNLLGCFELRLATEDEIQGAGLVAGSASPIGIRGIKKVGDDSITMGTNFVVGGNKPDTHLRNANYPRDFAVDLIADIALAQAGNKCPQCGAELCSTQGIEVGHLFKLGTLFSSKLGAYYLNREGKQRPIAMGCYGIGLSRLLAAAVEHNHDDKGIIWTPAIAPYQVYLCPLNMDKPEIAQEAERLYHQLCEQGVEVLFDDRLESPGVKFNDADLLGLPLRLTLSPRTLKARSAEIKLRTEGEAELVPLERIGEGLTTLLRASP
jgi:prolyl-tRNA synthetase